MTLIQMPAASTVRRSEQLLAVLGWSISSIELDSVRKQLDIVLTRHNGRRVHLRATPKYAVVERWRARYEFRVPHGSGGMVPRVDCVEHEFLGRQQFAGAQSAMRHLASYVEDNAVRALPVGAGRSALRPLLGEYLRLVA